MNYKLIRNEEQFHKFINFLPELKENESYFVILIARKKWNPTADIPSSVKLKRESLNNKDKIYSTIKQWEVEVGTYQHNGVEISQDNLGVYIGYNPKNQQKACFDLIEKCLEVIKTDRKNINIKSMANDVIQSSNGSKNFIDIDVDIKEDEDYETIVDYITSAVPASQLTFVKTNGGFHCLIKLSQMKDKQNWYQLLQKHSFKSELNIMSHDLMPVPGCNQGKFIPYIF